MNWGWAFVAQVKQPLATPASHIRVPVPVLTILLLIQFAANEPGKAEVGPHTWPLPLSWRPEWSSWPLALSPAHPWMLGPFKE